LGVALGVVAVTTVVEFPGAVSIDSLDTTDAEVAALAIQIEEMRRSEDRMLMAVMSMIGIAFGSFAVAGLFFTRMHDRDIKFIHRELADDFQRDLESVKASETRAKLELEQKVFKQLSEMSKPIRDYTLDRINQFEHEKRVQRTIYELQARVAELEGDSTGALFARIGILRTPSSDPTRGA
jgi:hypothetical protein